MYLQCRRTGDLGRLRPSPDRNLDYAGDDSRNLAIFAHLLRVSAAPNVAHGTPTGRTGLEPAKCREGVDSRHLSRPRRAAAARRGDKIRSDADAPPGKRVFSSHALPDIQGIFSSNCLRGDIGRHGGRRYRKDWLWPRGLVSENIVRQGEPSPCILGFQLGGPADFAGAGKSRPVDRPAQAALATRRASRPASSAKARIYWSATKARRA